MRDDFGRDGEMIGEIIIAVIFFAGAFIFGDLTADQPFSSYEELEMLDPTPHMILMQYVMYAAFWLAVLDYPKVAFGVLMTISVLEWLLLAAKRPEYWGGIAFANAGVDILAVLVLAERTGLPRCLGRFFGY